MRRLIIILIIAILLVGIFIIATNNLNLAKKADSNEFIKTYSDWMIKVAKNSVNTVGYVIKMDWVPNKQ
jgi:flagellar basal body-associated protein FliL